MQAVSGAPTPQRIGEILLSRGCIDDDLDRALELQKERGEKIGHILVDPGFCAQRDVLQALSGSAQHPAGYHRRSARGFAGNRKALAAASFGSFAVCRWRCTIDTDARDGRPARFRDARGGPHIHRSARRARARGRAGNHRRRRSLLRRVGARTATQKSSSAKTARCPKISSIFATWRAKLRSSVSSTQ